MTSAPTAILWDNDGLLVDTERLYFRANVEVLGRHGVELTRQDFLEHYLLGSRGIVYMLERAGIAESQTAGIREERNERYAELLGQEEIEVPGAKQALALLARHYRMCIVTSSRPDHFEQIHRRTGMLEFVEFAVTAADVARTKPDPESYLAAARRIGVNPAQCLAVEDSQRGLSAAVAAGIRCWVIPTELTDASDFSAAERRFSNISALAEHLLSLAAATLPRGE